MSLTSIIRDGKRTNIKEWFNLHFPKPKLWHKPDIIILPSKTSSSYSGKIGTAFDYLMRFNLERINENIIDKRDWIAKSGYELLTKKLEMYTELKEVSIGKNMLTVNPKELLKDLQSEMNSALANYNMFIEEGILTEELINSVLFLAKLDIIVRSGIIDENIIFSEDKMMVNEIKRLYEIVPWERFYAKKLCLLNPTFGKGSKLVRGADADIIIDQNLIDIKSTKQYKLERNDLNQVIGYYLLSLLDNERNLEITSISIYFARYAYLLTIQLSEYYNLDHFLLLSDEFSNLIQNRNLKPNNNIKIKTNLDFNNELIKDDQDKLNEILGW